MTEHDHKGDIKDAFTYGAIVGATATSITWGVLIGAAVYFYPYWSAL